MKRSNNRLRLLYFIFLCFALAVIANVFVVTIFKVHWRSNTSLNDYVTSVSNVDETIFATRGKIYDSNGIVVAQDVQTYDIICYLDKDRLAAEGKIAYVDNPLYTARMLAPILGMEESKIYEYLTIDDTLYQTELGPSGRNLSQEQKDEIEALELNGIDFRNSYIRYYPYGESFSPQLLGFAKSDDNGKLVGQLGLEAYLNEELSGVDGVHSYQQDKHGYVLPGMYEEVTEAIDGYDVYLTIDANIQQALNDCLDKTTEFKEASRAWAAVVEIDSGKILAWGQTPSYDPNNITSEDVQVNYGSQLSYEPGSVMKSVIYGAAMDLGVYDHEATFDSGPYCYTADLSRTYSGNQLGCIYNVSRLNWGTIPLDYGLIYSSNVATATLLSSYVGENRYKSYLDDFRFYEKVNTDGIDEVSGYTNYGLSPVDNITASYGQGSSLTMLQLLQAYTAIFGNGEMLKPYFIDKIVDPNTNSVVYQGKREVVSTPIKEETAKELQELLRRVVADPEGTCRHYEAKTVGVMGKTGTSEIAVDGEYSESENIISCMLAFPYEKPKYMVYYAYISTKTLYYNYDVKPIPDLIDHIALLEDLVIDDLQTAENKVVKEYEMKKVTSLNIYDAVKELSDFTPIIIGDGTNVIKQYPEPQEKAYSNQKVFLLTDGNNLVVPDFNGWTRKDVVTYWSLTNLNIAMEGYGNVYEQSPSPNTVIDSTTQITVKMTETGVVFENLTDQNALDDKE